MHIPEAYKLQPESTGLKLMMDLLHRSRFQFPGMGMGFIHRMLDEAIDHCKSRFLGGKPLIALDQVKHQIAKIQSAFAICSAMCHRSAEHSGIENNMASDAVEANSMKAYITDLMQESAQTLTQLKGASGYKAESLGARGIVDSRPFQIFEGSNEMLYTQISETVTKLMTRTKTMNLYNFLTTYDLTKDIAHRYNSLLNFTVDLNLQQRKHVDLGKIISRVVSSGFLHNLGKIDFRSDLVHMATESIRHEIAMLVSSYRCELTVVPIEDYHSNSSWLNV